MSERHDPSWFMEMLPQVDVLVSAAPATKQTRKMKKTAILFCMSQGQLFDDRALVKVPKEGWIAGAGLDVFRVEPPPENHPIFDCPYERRGPYRQRHLVDLFAGNVRRHAAGMEPINVVAKQKGYSSNLDARYSRTKYFVESLLKQM